jgi:Skp family chaperone for outer membrane proteins
MKRPDPILEELHAIREALAKEQGYDMAKIARAAKEFAEKMGVTLVTRPPRRIPPTKKAP